MANYQAVLKVVAQTVLDAKLNVVDELLTFLETKVEVDEDVRNIFAEFKGTLKVEKVAAPKKSGKKSTDDDGNGKKKAASVFNLYVKDMMPVLKEKHPEVKNGKELMALASESWKTAPLGLFVKEKAVELKKANPTLDNVEIYAEAKAAYAAPVPATAKKAEKPAPEAKKGGKKAAPASAPKKAPKKPVLVDSEDEPDVEDECDSEAPGDM